jgi:hypothetical protein
MTPVQELREIWSFRRSPTSSWFAGGRPASHYSFRQIMQRGADVAAILLAQPMDDRSRNAIIRTGSFIVASFDRYSSELPFAFRNDLVADVEDQPAWRRCLIQK